MACYGHLRAKQAGMRWFNPVRYVINLAIALDQLGNTMTGGAPDETISSRAGRAAVMGRWWGRVLCWGLGVLDSGHCEKAIQAEIEGRHQAAAIKQAASGCHEEDKP